MLKSRLSVLGAILAGGRSRRFGSDKALAPLKGRYLIDHMIAALSSEVDDLVICGRSWRTARAIDDGIGAYQGPLAGLAAALSHARQRGYSHLASAPVDVLPFPTGIVRHLTGPQPRVLEDQFLIGVWPTSLADALAQRVRAGERCVRAWIADCGAEALSYPGHRININRPEDWEEALKSAEDEQRRTPWDILPNRKQVT